MKTLLQELAAYAILLLYALACAGAVLSVYIVALASALFSEE